MSGGSPGPNSLNKDARKKELMRITRENQSILKRIQQAGPRAQTESFFDAFPMLWCGFRRPNLSTTTWSGRINIGGTCRRLSEVTIFLRLLGLGTGCCLTEDVFEEQVRVPGGSQALGRPTRGRFRKDAAPWAGRDERAHPYGGGVGRVRRWSAGGGDDRTLESTSQGPRCAFLDGVDRSLQKERTRSTS